MLHFILQGRLLYNGLMLVSVNTYSGLNEAIIRILQGKAEFLLEELDNLYIKSIVKYKKFLDENIPLRISIVKNDGSTVHFAGSVE
jgi:hypothetical protein